MHCEDFSLVFSDICMKVPTKKSQFPAWQYWHLDSILKTKLFTKFQGFFAQCVWGRGDATCRVNMWQSDSISEYIERWENLSFQREPECVSAEDTNYRWLKWPEQSEYKRIHVSSVVNMGISRWRVEVTKWCKPEDFCLVFSEWQWRKMTSCW